MKLRLLVGMAIAAAMPALGLGDEIVARKNGSEVKLTGKIVVEAQDGGLLFQTRDAALWVIEADQLVSKTVSEEQPKPLSQKAIGEALLEELPDGFRIYKTKNFVIAFQTEKDYARWVGGLYERLFKGFKSYWEKKKKFDLQKPEYPLTAIIFRSRAAYARYVQRELGSDPGTMVAYYNLLTNRVAMYDLTAEQVRPGARLEGDRRINEILSSPNSLPMVATVIHEGTHQLMFNTGMQTRFSDTPLWINEGLAMYFETPDLKSSRGWRAIGQINYLRFSKFRQDLSTRSPTSLADLISKDERFHNSAQMLSAYAESWALNYFLLNKRPKAYVNYLKFMSQKKPLQYDTAEQRLTDFKKFLGDDLEALDREFVSYMARLR